MTLAEELGERKIIEMILKHLEHMPSMPIPFGDDVSAIDIGNRKLAVIKTDMLVGKTDVPPSMNPWQAARKAGQRLPDADSSSSSLPPQDLS